MLTLLGVGMILCFMYLIMSKRLSPIIALILIPFIFSLVAWGLGHYFESLSHIELKGLSEMMLDGIKISANWRNAFIRNFIFCLNDRCRSFRSTG